MYSTSQFVIVVFCWYFKPIVEVNDTHTFTMLTSKMAKKICQLLKITNAEKIIVSV